MPRALDRRRFLETGAAALAALGASGRSSLRAIEPFARRPSTRLKLSCAAYSLRKYLELSRAAMRLEDFIARCAEWGTDGVELTEYYFPKPLTPEYVLRLKRLAILSGQDVTGTPIGNRFTLPPGEEREREIERVKAWIDVSAELGSPAIRIFAGNAPSGVGEAQARKWVAECVEACSDRAAKRGVFLALENHGGVVATAEGLLEIVRAVRCEWFGVNLDTGNFHSEDPYAEMALAAPYAVTCQLKVEVQARGRPREETDIPRVVEILRKAGYRGYLTLEYEGAEEPLEAVPRYLEKMRAAIG